MQEPFVMAIDANQFARKDNRSQRNSGNGRSTSHQNDKSHFQSFFYGCCCSFFFNTMRCSSSA
jgi:hypothetical protein